MMENNKYSDFQIHFDKFQLLDLLSSLEETNLFLIHHVQEEESTLDTVTKEANEKINAKESEIEELNRKLNHCSSMVMRQKFQMNHMNNQTESESKIKENWVKKWKVLYKIISETYMMS